VVDKKGRLHTVTAIHPAGALFELESAHPVKRTVVEPGGGPVDTYVPSEEEALILLQDELGARLLFDIQDRERTLAGRAQFRVDPVKRTAVKLRDHIDWLHGVNVDDVLRRHQGTDVNPSTPKAKRASVEELAQAHDEMHDRPDIWPHSLPHHHARLES
jgi:hypothetical protein